MISVFSRNLRFCDTSNNYAALFDGTDDYATRGGVGVLKPNVDHYWSYWIRLNNTTSDATLRWHFGQAVTNNANEDFIRILYQAATSLNRLEFNFRSSTTSNQMTAFWELHGANSAITGSTSNTNYWNASNANIKKNANGYVHLFFHYKSVPFGQPHGFSDADCYWNGQLLNRTTKTAAGTVTSTGVTQTNHGLVINPVNLSTANVSNAFMDQLVMLSGTGSYATFLSTHNLTGASVAQVASFLYNQGCPRALVSDSRYTVWNFENNWNSTPAGISWTPANGATFTTTHA